MCAASRSSGTFILGRSSGHSHFTCVGSSNDGCHRGGRLRARHVIAVAVDQGIGVLRLFR